MADIGSVQAALLSSGVLQKHLLPRLCLSDVLRVESLNKAFQQLICCAPDAVWSAVIALTVPPSHPLAQARLQNGCQQAARRYAALQRAIKTRDISTTSVKAVGAQVYTVSQRGNLVAVFAQGGETVESESNVFLFKLGQQEPVQHLRQHPASDPDEGLCLHTWSPDHKKLALFWDGYPDVNPNCLHIACLSQTATAEREYFGESFTPMRWSPDSRLVQLLIQDDVHNKSKLLVLTPQLETVYCWPEVEIIGSSLCHDDIVPAWTSAGVAIIAARQRGSPPHQGYVLDACWHQSRPDVGSSAEAALVRSLLASVALSPQEWLMELAFSPMGGLAAVTGSGADHSRSDCPYKLHVLLPGCPLKSMPVCFTSCSLETALVWSPAGDWLLVGCLEGLQLVSTDCELILNLPEEAWAPTFTPDGRYAAVLSQTGCIGARSLLNLQLFSTCSGASVFEHAWDGFDDTRSSMDFNRAGDQLVVTDIRNAHAFQFGQGNDAGDLSSRQLCEAIAAAGSAATAALPANYDEGEFEDDQYWDE